MTHKDQAIEQERLTNTRDSIASKLKSLARKLKQPTRDRVEAELRRVNLKKHQEYDLLYPQPFHGRLIFKKNDYTEDVYIGKFHFDGPFTVHSVWSPVGEFFIQGLNSGKFVDEILLKRYIDNYDGIISKIHDQIVKADAAATVEEDQVLSSETPTREEILEKVGLLDQYIIEKLSVHSSNRMKDIVATLQKEQDEIIRRDFNSILIIQGVAGSGKTAVALHRIAYLVYTFKEKMKKILVIGPNKVYLNYISMLLPGLGISDALQETFTDIAKGLCRVKKVPVVNDRGLDETFLRNLQDLIKELEEQYFNTPGITFKQGNKEVKYNMPRSILEKIPVNKRPETCEKIIRENIIVDFGLTRTGFISVGKKKKLKVSRKIVDITEYNMHFLENVKEYIKKLPTYTVDDILDIIRSRFGAFGGDDYLGVRLIVTKYLNGLPVYDHIVVDEAQNLSPVVFASILCLQNEQNKSLTVLGDICQRLDSELFSWDIFRDIAGPDTKKYVLRYGYRSTDNIVSICNNVIRFVLSANDFVQYSTLPIGRQGSIPDILSLNEKSLTIAVKEILDKTGVNVVAIICKNEAESKKAYDALSPLDPVMIGGTVLDYGDSGILIMTGEHSRGLEFDAVIIPDAHCYGYNFKDAKAFYLAISRAMHHLLILHDNRIPQFLTT